MDQYVKGMNVKCIAMFDALMRLAEEKGLLGALITSKNHISRNTVK